MKRKTLLKETASFLVITLAGFIYAIGINLFIAPNQITVGGFTGISIIANYLFKFPIGITLLILNIPLLLFSIKSFGMKIIVKTLIATAIMSVFIDLTAGFQKFTDDMLVSAIYGGVLTGIALGLMLANGSTSGGSDILAYHIQRIFKHFSIGKIILVIDGVVVAASAIVFKNIEKALYAGVAIIISTWVIDSIVSGFDYAKTVFIITKKSEEISKEILEKLKHGVTKLNATGMYTGENKDLLMIVIKRFETYALKDIIYRIDPEAFIILNDSSEVYGQGFKTENNII